MIKVQIKKNNIITNNAIFESQELAELWVEEQKSYNSFGLNQRWSFEANNNVLDTKEIINEEDGTFKIEYLLSAEYNLEYIDITAEFSAEAERLSKIELGKAARQACQSVLDYIAGANLDKELTIQQITTMQTTYANAEAALRAGRPTYAKQFISAITPDGTIVTAAEKANCLSLLADY